MQIKTNGVIFKFMHYFSCSNNNNDKQTEYTQRIFALNPLLLFIMKVIIQI